MACVYARVCMLRHRFLFVFYGLDIIIRVFETLMSEELCQSNGTLNTSLRPKCLCFDTCPRIISNFSLLISSYTSLLIFSLLAQSLSSTNDATLLYQGHERTCRGF
jgi:hypothetical protein